MLKEGKLCKIVSLSIRALFNTVPDANLQCHPLFNIHCELHAPIVSLHYHIAMEVKYFVKFLFYGVHFEFYGVQFRERGNDILCLDTRMKLL